MKMSVGKRWHLLRIVVPLPLTLVVLALFDAFLLTLHGALVFAIQSPHLSLVSFVFEDHIIQRFVVVKAGWASLNHFLLIHKVKTAPVIIIWALWGFINYTLVPCFIIVIFVAYFCIVPQTLNLVEDALKNLARIVFNFHLRRLDAILMRLLIRSLISEASLPVLVVNIHLLVNINLKERIIFGDLIQLKIELNDSLTIFAGLLYVSYLWMGPFINGF